MEGEAKVEGVYTLEEETIEESDDDLEFEEVVEEDDEDLDDEEDLETAMKTILKKDGPAGAFPAHVEKKAEVQRRPEVIDDFIRNFLISKSMTKTLEAFQTEWYELQQKGKLSDEDVAVVPDLYLRNRQLDGIIQQLRKDLEKAQEVAEKAKNTWDKLRKERDFHRMHHKRVVQEKNKLVVDIKRLKKHYSHFEPTLKELQHKYEVAMKEKMLMRLERDKLSHKVESLERTVKADVPKRSLPSPNQSGGKSQDKKISMTHAETNKENANEDSVLPPDDRENPFLDSEFDPPKVENMSLRKTFKAHGAAVSNICVHPRKPILGTCSDDGTWRMYSIPNGDLIMSGDGHKDWVSGMDFHPRGTHAVTGSGDGTVKIWSFSSASCTSTLRDHTQAVWSVAYHDLGDFVVSASMDHTAKLWDTATGRCQQTFRGHVDSVNHVTFQPFSNNICTASGDKTVSLWDSRSGLCIQTFYGHLNSVTCAAFSLRGDTIASSDADGVVKIWDVRMVAEREEIITGDYPVNQCHIDRSGSNIACACDDGFVRVYSASDGSLLRELEYEDAVQCVKFDTEGKHLIAAGSDGSVRMWA